MNKAKRGLIGLTERQIEKLIMEEYRAGKIFGAEQEKKRILKILEPYHEGCPTTCNICDIYDKIREIEK